MSPRGGGLVVTYLAGVPEAIPVFAGAFLRDGFAHPDDRSVEDVATRLAAGAHTDALPLALVAFEGDELAGTVALRAESIPQRADLAPWVAGLYVLPARRGRRVGSALVAGAEREARRLGHRRLYAGTSSAHSLFRRAGWAGIDQLEHDGTPMVIYRRDLVP